MCHHPGEDMLPEASACGCLVCVLPTKILWGAQVRGLLQLFLDIERTDRSNTFYEKFTTRYKAGEILCELPAPVLLSVDKLVNALLQVAS